MSVPQDLPKSFTGIRGWVASLISPNRISAAQRRLAVNNELKSNWPEYDISAFEVVLDKPPKDRPEGDTTSLCYLVFIDEDFQIDWITKGRLPEGASKVISEAHSVAAKRCNHLPREQLLELRRLTGQSLVDAFEGNFLEGKTLARAAELFLKDRTIERSSRLLNKPPILAVDAKFD